MYLISIMFRNRTPPHLPFHPIVFQFSKQQQQHMEWLFKNKLLFYYYYYTIYSIVHNNNNNNNNNNNYTCNNVELIRCPCQQKPFTCAITLLHDGVCFSPKSLNKLKNKITFHTNKYLDIHSIYKLYHHTNIHLHQKQHSSAAGYCVYEQHHACDAFILKALEAYRGSVQKEEAQIPQA